jgi:hypothetical protein
MWGQVQNPAENRNSGPLGRIFLARRRSWVCIEVWNSLEMENAHEQTCD